MFLRRCVVYQHSPHLSFYYRQIYILVELPEQQNLVTTHGLIRSCRLVPSVFALPRVSCTFSWLQNLGCFVALSNADDHCAAIARARSDLRGPCKMRSVKLLPDRTMVAVRQISGR